MQANKCQQVKDALVDYIELEVLNKEREGITKHLAGCAQCRREYDELANLLGSLPKAPVPDPGDAYWSMLSAQVLAEVKQKRRANPASSDSPRTNNVINLHGVRHNKAVRNTNGTDSQELPAAPKRRLSLPGKRLIMSVAAALLMAVGAVALMPGYEDTRFDAVAFQSSLSRMPNLNAALQRMASDAASSAAHYSFMDQGHVVTSYRLGKVLVTGLAYASNRDAQAAERAFLILRNGLLQLGLSSKDVARLQGNATSENLAGESRQIEDFFRNNKPEIEWLYFRVGMLSTSSTLLLSAGRTVTQIEKERLVVLINALQRRDAPTGIIALLKDMDRVLASKTFTAREIRQYERLRQNLDGLMG